MKTLMKFMRVMSVRSRVFGMVLGQLCTLLMGTAFMKANGVMAVSMVVE